MFKDDGSPDTLRSLVQNDPTGETAEEFRRWQTGVLQPLNRRAAETIMEHADLTDSLVSRVARALSLMDSNN